ncbi:hypothetical protein B0T18DRAFT_8060 [Schizothecium vesticola]|uniref:Uncharacterized protein n=1 Tax=Schizothecium vesticola TaxID=314040 RepID=A0AA40F9F9_9PEZI|nr:hypothetical protein B0T18DRAFT_8060 [Schizothecium vesticola]
MGRFLLVPDDQLSKVQQAVAELGFSPADEDVLPSQYGSEMSGSTIRYHVVNHTAALGYGLVPKCRLAFLPLSWTGITLDEVVPILEDDGLSPPLPPSTLTVPLSAACAALARIAARQECSHGLRRIVLEQISGIVTYTPFDMSYEGDYMDIPPKSQPLSDAEVLEIEQAVAVVQGWKMREGEQWITDTLVDIFRGKKYYSKFPRNKAEIDGTAKL